MLSPGGFRKGPTVSGFGLSQFRGGGTGFGFEGSSCVLVAYSPELQ